MITIPSYEHVVFDVIIEDLVPEELFRWRWHPHATDAGVDYSAEPRTLVAFTLEDSTDGGTEAWTSSSTPTACSTSLRAAGTRLGLWSE